jgi:hypothetical protein
MKYTFLLSSERSGSNLITRIMDCHSSYCGPSPVHLLRLLLDNRGRYGNLSDESNWKRLIQDALALYDSKTGLWKSKWNFEQLKTSVEDRSLTALLRTIFEQEARLNGKPGLFIKENHLYRYLPFVLSAVPQARIVYLVRDPRDMALSWKLSPILRGGVIRAANVWQHDQQAALQVFRWLYDFEKIYMIHYEHLVAEPENVLRDLCSFLGIEFEHGMLEFSRDRQTVANAGRASDWKNLQKPVMTTNFNKYKKGLSEKEIQYVEAVCHQEMAQLGYTREYTLTGERADLEAAVSPLERYEKEEYVQVPEAERQLRQTRTRVLRRIEAQPLLPVWQVHAKEVIAETM